MSRHKETTQSPADMPEIFPAKATELMAAQDAYVVLQAETEQLAAQLGYEGALTVGTLEDEIRFFQQRTVECLLETGKRLLLLKQMTPHGEFAARVEVLGFAERTARRFMQAASKAGKSATVAVLAGRTKNQKAFLELITHDDDVIDNLAEMDGFDRMSASQLRAKVREMEADKNATEKVLANRSAQIDKLSRHIAKSTPDQVLLELQKESTALMNDALGCVRGQIRSAFIALKNHSDDDNSLFMAGLVGQLQGDLNALREEFNLPDISTVADQALAAEVAQWGTPASH